MAKNIILQAGADQFIILPVNTIANARCKKILLLSYSFSGQTNVLLRNLTETLEAGGHLVYKEKLSPTVPLRFPVGSITGCIKMMLTTFCRQRIPIAPLSEPCREPYDLMIIAGPTWSYNPSGPILSLIDRDGPTLFKDQTIIPLISCRGYWRMHQSGLTRLLRHCGATIPNCMVFSHPNSEPWRTIGVFLKIAGKTPERAPIIGSHYHHFGHSKEQLLEAARFGALLDQALVEGTPLAALDFQTKTALP